ncbi:MAG: SMP-30/gluconolactonase/LRE family protein [Terriglobia bacterium]
MTEYGQAKSANQVMRMDPGFDEIISTSTAIERIASGFSFVEGPVWVRDGNYLLFSDIPNNVINKWSPDGRVSVFLEESGFSGELPRPVPKLLTMENLLGYLVGSNGTTLDKEGRLIFCEHGNRRVERLEKDGRRTVVADSYEAKRLNSPNDVVTKSDGAIYFSDPPFGLEKMDEDPRKELPFNGLYRVHDGKIQLLTKDLKAPNGLAFSPDEKYLYADDSGTGMYWRYEVKPDGTIGNGRLFFDLSKSADPGVADGIKIDANGNVYACGPGGVWILSPEGKVLGRFQPPEDPANIAWGDDGKSLYMTAWTSLYRVRLKIPGIRP